MSTTKERPILFSAPMVRAILDGSKTQTRRVVKPQPTGNLLGLLHRSIRSRNDPPVLRAWFQAAAGEQSSQEITCPYGAPADRLWVRETFARVPVTAYRCSTGVQQTEDPGDPDMCAVYREGWDRSCPGHWRPSIFMPRWASRILLEIADVRVQRLQEISPDDSEAEGVNVVGCAFPRGGSIRIDAFARLWESINGDGSWDANPWVWAISFRRLQP